MIKKLTTLTILLLTISLTGCSFDQQESPSLPKSEEKEIITSQVTSEIKNINPVSLEALFEKKFNGNGLTLGKTLQTTKNYTRYYITYQSGDLTISGIMSVPKGDGPFPVLILNHGHIDTSIYTNGRGLRREQDYLANAGYVVIHPDYRNHASSSKDDRDEILVRLGYVEDVINAVYALKNSDLPFIDKERIGMLGHSMGGGITLSVLVTQPDLVKAAVLYAPVSGDARDSFERWMSGRRETAEKIEKLYGAPQEQPEFWNGISAETFYDRISAPIVIFHGDKDESVPLEWSKKTIKLLSEKEKSAQFTVYEGEHHEFGKDWENFMRDSEAFFDEHLL